MVAVRHNSAFRKLLSLVLMALVLLLPLASNRVEPDFASVEDTRLEFAFTANDEEVDAQYLLKTEPELSSNLVLAPAEGLRIAGDGSQLSVNPGMTVPSLKEIISTIFIPPKITS